jgi:beta-lactamase class A
VRLRSAVRPLALFFAGLVVFALGWISHARLDGRVGRLGDRHVRAGGFRLVSPLLDVELPEGFGVEREPIPFRAKVARFVDEQVRSGRVREMSVYYRDLMDGPWFGVNEDRKYDPASMMKVPVMIAWLKRAERDPHALEASFAFDEAAYPGSEQRLVPDRTLAAGGRYTVEQLLHYMLAYSDNRAMWLLFGAIGTEELNDVLDSMDVTNDPSDASNATSVVGFSGFFRILFNAAYLNREMSERALEMLALQDFPEGFIAGVPKGTIVASKFGETAPARPGGELQLHEFGIVYAPSGPYILGVMTVGHDRSTQAGVLRDVSALIYAELSSQSARWPSGGARQATRR